MHNACTFFHVLKKSRLLSRCVKKHIHGTYSCRRFVNSRLSLFSI